MGSIPYRMYDVCKKKLGGCGELLYGHFRYHLLAAIKHALRALRSNKAVLDSIEDRRAIRLFI
jgi:hypothetical protein